MLELLWNCRTARLSRVTDPIPQTYKADETPSQRRTRPLPATFFFFLLLFSYSLLFDRAASDCHQSWHLKSWPRWFTDAVKKSDASWQIVVLRGAELPTSPQMSPG